MKKVIISISIFILLFSEINCQIIYQSDFEQFTVGSLLAQSDPQNWTTWSNQPGGSEDAVISDTYAFSGSKSVKVTGSTDAVLPLPNYTSGYFEISFKMYIPSGYTGFFDLLQLFDGWNSQWGMQVFFNADGTGSIDGGGASAATFTYSSNTWMLIENKINIDSDFAAFYINDILIHSWQWSKGAFGTSNIHQLGGINMYAWNESGTDLHFFDDLIVIRKETHLNLKVYLEGPFLNNEMLSTLNTSGYIPTIQPYNIPPWNYWGNESVDVIPNSDIIDWVLVEILRKEISGEDTSYFLEKRRAGFLLKNGMIKDTDGLSMLMIHGLELTDFYVRIIHRNHISITSSVTLIMTDDIYNYDFTLNQNQVFGGLCALKEFTPNHWGMIGGDGNGNNQIENKDKDDIWFIHDGFNGYSNSDYNMDGQVNLDDLLNLWKINCGKGSNFSLALTGFNCGDLLIDERDGQSYTTVQIGDQCWMAENINIGSMISVDQSMTNNGIIEKYCYNNSYGNCMNYGGLYDWNEMMQYTTQEGIQGICPAGWHIPSDSEYTILIDYLGGESIAGGKMKESGTTHWNTPNTGATNESGFSAFGGGISVSTIFLDLKQRGYFYSSTLNGLRPMLGYNNASVTFNGYPFDFRKSVRCIKNEPPGIPYNPLPSDGSQNQHVNSILQWSCSHHSPLTYDIFFDTLSSPQLVSSSQSISKYYPGNLQFNKAYYWKIIAHDSYGNHTEGPIWSFITGSQDWECGIPIIDERDGQYYNTVQINTICWMADNLNIGTMIQGANNMENNSIFEKYCYNNNTANCEIYGGLYQWNEMMQYITQEGIQGICPTGWHIPADADYAAVTDYLGGESIAGGKMKSTGTIQDGTGLWYAPNFGATNESGFSALPGGMRYEGYFDGNPGQYAIFWSSTGFFDDIWFHSLDYGNINVSRSWGSKEWGLSVRCIKGEYINLPPSLPSTPQPPDGAINQTINIALSWTCVDPENDPLTYDVYFGTTNPPELLSSGQLVTTLNPGTLNYSTTYYWKIVASDNHNNFTESPIWSFITGQQEWQCGGILLDSRDAQSYNTIQIGTQCWMKENVSYLPSVYPPSSGSQTIHYYYVYGYEGSNVTEAKATSNYQTYGVLYNWPSAITACPEGWHLPSDSEWDVLINYLGGSNVAGGAMKEIGTAHWQSPNSGASNSSGFTGLPGGNRLGIGTFSDVGINSTWWSSTEYSSTKAWARGVTNISSIVYNYNYDKGYYGFSVRCLKY
jgi:uncharacterized protein (TIGR02145 family)